eukprot:3778706-Heterocapsa_arctica.AAC.1
METDRNRRAVPMGLKDREVHEAGAKDDGKLRNYEQNACRYRSYEQLGMIYLEEETMFKVGEMTMFCRRFISSLISFEDEIEQRKQYEHLRFLGYTQVPIGQGNSRRSISNFKGDESRSRLRALDHGKHDGQKERNNKPNKLIVE